MDKTHDVEPEDFDPVVFLALGRLLLCVEFLSLVCRLVSKMTSIRVPYTYR